MFKLFGVKEDNGGEIIDDIEVEIDENSILKEEVGQVALDILESNDDVIIVAPIAGIELEDIDLSLNKTILTIKGRRDQPKEYEIEGVKERNLECFWGAFTRNVILPENLALNKIRAYMENNLLIINIPKLKFEGSTIKINKIES